MTKARPRLFRSKKDFLHEFSLVVKLMQKRAKESDLATVAGSLAYTTILSIIPALAVSFAMFQAFGGLEKLYAIIEPFVLSHLAEGTGDEVVTQLRLFLGNVRTTTIGVGGFLGLILTTLTMLNSFEKALNATWAVATRRSLYQRISSYWLFITLGPLALSIVLGVTQSKQIPFRDIVPGYFASFLLNWGLFFLVYKIVPNARVRSRCAALGALVASLLFVCTQRAYGIYTAKVVSYNKVYGSLGAVPILLLWIYLVWLILLWGSALAYALQNRGLLKVTIGDKPDGRA